MGYSTLVSKYDSYWRGLLPTIKALLDEAKEYGTSQEIDVSGLAKIGERKNWNGRVDVSNSIAKSAMAHTASLGNVLVDSSMLDDYRSAVFRLSVSKTLKLCVRFLSQTDLSLEAKERLPQPKRAVTETILETEDYGNFYGLIRDFELAIRHFIIEMLGKKWLKRLENDIPNVVKGWKERQDVDRKWKTNPEENLIDYADITDYMQIVRKYRKLFTKNDDELEEVMTNFKIFAIMGRNPMMHFRTVTEAGYYATRNAEIYLQKWVKRTRERAPVS